MISLSESTSTYMVALNLPNISFVGSKAIQLLWSCINSFTRIMPFIVLFINLFLNLVLILFTLLKIRSESALECGRLNIFKRKSEIFLNKRTSATAGWNDNHRVCAGCNIWSTATSAISWKAEKIDLRLALFLKKLYTSLTKSSHRLGSCAAAFLAQICREWHIHFEIYIPGQAAWNLVITEFFDPIIVLQPSLAKPMQLSSGTSFFSKTDVIRPKMTSALAIEYSLS